MNIIDEFDLWTKDYGNIEILTVDYICEFLKYKNLCWGLGPVKHFIIDIRNHWEGDEF